MGRLKPPSAKTRMRAQTLGANSRPGDELTGCSTSGPAARGRVLSEQRPWAVEARVHAPPVRSARPCRRAATATSLGRKALVRVVEQRSELLDRASADVRERALREQLVRQARLGLWLRLDPAAGDVEVALCSVSFAEK
jgi:hypothetical protein